jgi:hypothetical protein
MCVTGAGDVVVCPRWCHGWLPGHRNTVIFSRLSSLFAGKLEEMVPMLLTNEHTCWAKLDAKWEMESKNVDPMQQRGHI